MRSLTRPRGRLPARVYWTRRLVLLALVLGAVFGISHLVGGSGDPAGAPAASPAAATEGSASVAPAPTPSASLTPSSGPTPSAGPTPTAGATGGKPEKKQTPLAVPTGPCDDQDVLVTPVIDDAVAGKDVHIELRLNTLQSPACTWEASAESLVLKLTSGSDRIWSTQDCPKAIETEQVVVRKEHDTSVEVVWPGRRSDDDCSNLTEWARPGYYHAVAAALGAEPTDVQFHLQRPTPVTITPSPTADPKHKDGERADADED